jgi:hypothetical protein
MQFGDPLTFAIECVHEPIANENRWVFGRMRLWLHGLEVGDYDEAACMLNVTAGHLQGALERLPGLDEPAFSLMSDVQVFHLLDAALYADDQKATDHVAADALRYRKFDFLTAGGESFNREKSFIWLCEGEVCIVSEEPTRGIVRGRVAASDFTHTVAAFLAWLDAEGRKHAG